MSMSPEELEKVIQNAVEKALTRSFIRYLKFAVGVPLVLFLILAIAGIFLLKMNGQI